jgi:hypothetical protein
MAGESRRTSVRVDSDGVRTIEVAGVRWALWAAAAVVAAIAIAILLLRAGSGGEASEQIAAAPAPSAEGDAPRKAQPPHFKPVRRAEPAEARAPVPAKRDQPQDTVPAAERAAEEHDAAAQDTEDDTPTGIALFPPPGTDPIKRGIVVPDDFELPPGYVRHYQATDDGRRLPAILMFHPDYDWVDESGAPIVVPEDGVVPPELAPAGLPLEMLEVPEVVIPVIEEPAPGEAATD